MWLNNQLGSCFLQQFSSRKVHPRLSEVVQTTIPGRLKLVDCARPDSRLHHGLPFSHWFGKLNQPSRFFLNNNVSCETAPKLHMSNHQLLLKSKGFCSASTGFRSMTFLLGMGHYRDTDGLPQLSNSGPKFSTFQHLQQPRPAHPPSAAVPAVDCGVYKGSVKGIVPTNHLRESEVRQIGNRLPLPSSRRAWLS